MDQGSASNNLINNYKGVMLCSRPNQVQNSIIEKPFCGRVVPRQQLGLVPTKDEREINYSPKKPRLQILNRHKQWLDKFKKDIEKKKNQIQQTKKQQDDKFKKIRQQAEADRDRAKKMKQEYNQTASNVMNILNDDLPKITSSQLTPQNLNKLNRINEQRQLQTKSLHQQSIKNHEEKQNVFKKKKKSSKPLWAQTQQQVEKNQQQEVDELLDFFTSNHVEDYAQDSQVKDILSNLKQKIQKLQQEEDWKQKQLEKIKQRKQQRQMRKQENQNNDQDDKYTHFSGQSQGRSVASEKTQQKIQELKAKKKEQQDWDKFTTSQKSSIVGIDEKIAKNIADEVLRNYPNLRGVHSNVSIRKLLEQQAAKVMNEPIARPVITTIIRQKQKIDANNLPYLHRNPAI